MPFEVQSLASISIYQRIPMEVASPYSRLLIGSNYLGALSDGIHNEDV